MHCINHCKLFDIWPDDNKIFTYMCINIICRKEKKRAQENDPLIKLLQSALEAAQQKANKR